MRIPVSITALLLVFLSACAGEPFSNDICYMDGLSVDGNPADWQERGTVFPLIADIYGEIDTSDFQGALRLGWNERGIWFLLEFLDDTLQGRIPGNRARDQFEIFVAEKPCSNEMVQYLLPELSEWSDPPLVNKFDYRAGVPVPDVDEIAVACGSFNGIRFIEVFIPADPIGFPLEAGRPVSINCKYVDADGTGSNAYTLSINNNTYINHCNLMTVNLSAIDLENRNTVVARTWMVDKETVMIRLLGFKRSELPEVNVKNVERKISEVQWEDYGRWVVGSAEFVRKELKEKRSGFRLAGVFSVSVQYYFRDIPQLFIEYEPFNGFEYDISRFEEMDLLDPPSDSAVMFLGSSSIRLWSTLEEDFPEMEVFSRGFGGSKTTDMLHYFDRLFGGARPAAIVYFCGNNDLVRGVSPDSVVTNITLFLDRITEELPEAHVYVLSLKASISQIRTMENVKRTNRILGKRLQDYPNATYVDVIHTMLDEHGQPLPEIFSPDNNHMNRAGYRRWTEVLGPVLKTHKSRKKPNI